MYPYRNLVHITPASISNCNMQFYVSLISKQLYYTQKVCVFNIANLLQNLKNAL